MATRQGSLIPEIKIPGTIDDRATLSALESIKDCFDAMNARKTAHFQKIPFTGDIRTLTEIAVYHPQTLLELTNAFFLSDTSVTAPVIMTLTLRSSTGEAPKLVGSIDGRVSGFAGWQAWKPRPFNISGPRRIDAGHVHTLQCAPNGAASPLHGTLALSYREVV